MGNFKESLIKCIPFIIRQAQDDWSYKVAVRTEFVEGLNQYVQKLIFWIWGISVGIAFLFISIVIAYTVMLLVGGE
jgi:hypothetical protein